MGMDGAMIMRRGGWRGWAAWMLLPALLLVALVPRGYMPDANALRRGDLSLTLCRVVAPASATDGERGATASHALPCPFALLPIPAAAREPAAIPQPWGWSVFVTVLVARRDWRAGPWIMGLGARGPPGG